jgi:hypothetical protein
MSTTVLAYLILFMGFITRLGERCHRSFAHLGIAMRQGVRFVWVSRLANDQQQQPQALPNTDQAKAA